MNEIVPDIFTWAWFSEPHGYNFNGHLVRRQSVRKLLDLEFDTLLVGDGTSILHDAKARLKELLATFPGG